MNIKHNRDKSGFSHHILSEVHDYSNNISSVEVLETCPKPSYLNTLEKFHIYKSKQSETILNEHVFEQFNPIFDIL
jgi:hypothetical protein